jgi:hypothetical protein
MELSSEYESSSSFTNDIINNNSNSNSLDDFSINKLNYIRETIENMNKFNQIEVLRLLKKHKNVFFNENKYGVHINLTELSNNIIEELEIYINYVNTQEDTLHEAEQQKETFKNIYFAKDNKDNNIKIHN